MATTQPTTPSADKRPWRRLYGTARWQAIRQDQLSRQPLCIMCVEGDEVTVADTVDHVTPHRGDLTLFWSGPFQSLCAPCHSGRKQREELGLKRKGCDANGWPLE